MHRILFYVGERPIYTYGLMIALGIIAGVALAYYLAGRTRGKFRSDVLDFAVWAVAAGMLGARLAYVVPRIGDYLDNPLGMIAIWEGGLSIQGALIGGFVAAIIFTRVRGIKFWEFADVWAPGLILGQAIGRVGCYFNGDTFGLPTNQGWGLVFPPGTDAYARFGAQPLYPTQLFELGWDLAILALLLFLFGKKRVDGLLFIVYAGLWSLGTATIRFYRGDLAVQVASLTGGQVVGFITAAIAAGVAIYLWRRGTSAVSALLR